MIVADFKVLQLGETSQDRAVEDALRVLEQRGVRYAVGPLGTTVETDSLRELLDVVQAAHAQLRGHGGRIFTQLTIDERLDKDETAESLARNDVSPDVR